MDYRAAYSCRSNAQRDGDRLGGMCRRVMDTGGAVKMDSEFWIWFVSGMAVSAIGVFVLHELTGFPPLW